MGADTFMQRSRGANAEEAFGNAVSVAAYEHGHGGYTGTIAEKDCFVLIDVPKGASPQEYAQKLLNGNDERIDDKWGPAGCIHLGGDDYLFFGWASS